MRESSNMRYMVCILIYSTVSNNALPSSPRNGGIPLVSHRGSFFSENFGVIVVGLYVS